MLTASVLFLHCAHRPLFFSRWPLVWCRNALCLDGFFCVPRSRFGCPPLEAERTVAITALPKVKLDAFAASDLIQPGPRFPSAPLPMSDGEWFSYAMNAADDQLVERMRSLGREHASLWAEEQPEQVLQPGERPPPPREGIAQA